MSPAFIGNVRQAILGSPAGNRLLEIAASHVRLQPHQHFRPWTRPHRIPHLRFAAPTGGLLVHGREVIAGMHLHG